MSDRRSTRDATVPVPRVAGLAAVLGTWIFWSGVFFTGSGWIILNNVLVGAAIATLAAYTAAQPSGGRLPALAAPLPLVPLGLWTVAAPFVFGTPVDVLFWSNVVAGGLVTILAAAGVYGSWRRRTATATGA
ncbi:MULTISPECIES: SPW repeat domain-containing protein [Natrialbaceae]|uniref:SPW repeat domain-containing protein n=1 Tax=Natrialbaceae TaxID=1644061 RepID=UPI00207D435C|nr:SPW repeat protein [Natronococcus sp. CG52]